jgi:uncharacterized protein YgbK (DUF1537 family)
MQIRVIADDFASATDALPAFAQRGWSTRVVLRSAPASTPGTSEVWSTDTDSRTLPDEAAAVLAASWAGQWREADILVKQFDSTVRGPVAAEVLAAWQASGRSKLIVAPAFPAAGRTTDRGHVLVDGVPVHQTSFASDPLNPVRVSSLPALFGTHGLKLPCARDAAEAMAQLAMRTAVVVDATTEADLQALVRHAGDRRDVLWAGSTGLLRALAATLQTQAEPRPAWQAAQRPGLVVGSQNPRSREQHRQAQTRAKGAILWATPEEPGDPDRLTAQLVDEVCEAVMAGRCDGLVVTGGETAKHIARRLQAQEIRVLQEVQPGIPLCLMRTPRGVIPLVTKAGGFGDDDVFMQCLQALTGVHA